MRQILYADVGMLYFLFLFYYLKHMLVSVSYDMKDTDNSYAVGHEISVGD